MKQRQLAKFILVTAGCIGAGAVHASGFQLLEQNASGLGNAYAGSAAVADNASTIFYNPAGMTRLQPRAYSVGLTAFNTSYKFSNGMVHEILASGGFIPEHRWTDARDWFGVFLARVK